MKQKERFLRSSTRGKKLPIIGLATNSVRASSTPASHLSGKATPAPALLKLVRTVQSTDFPPVE